MKSLPALLMFVLFFTSTCIYGVEGAKVFNKVKSLVYKVKVSRDANSPKFSYGSGFPIHKAGIIVTNYHVISNVFDKETQYKSFVVIGNKTYKAQVIAVNVINDLALLRIQKKFNKTIAISTRTPKKGAKTFSIGHPKDLPLTIVPGTYNGIIKRGVYEEIHMSSPINSGMSGGPTLDSRGHLIGINVATLLFSQNISFAVPVKKLNELLNQTNLKNEEAITKESINQVTNQQLFLAQEELGRELIDNDKRHQLKNWRVFHYPKYVKCWQSTHVNEKEKNYEVEQFNCNINNAARLSHKLNTGYYKADFKVYENKKLNGLQYYQLIYDHLKTPSDITGFFHGYKKENAHTKTHCQNVYLLNIKKIPLKVNYCLQAYNEYDNIYDAYIDIVTLLKENNELVMSFNLYGFSRKNIKSIVKKHINSIEKSTNESNSKNI